MRLSRSSRGLSAASGVGWFFLFAFLTVAVLSYKGVGVIKYPPEAANIPVIGAWLNVPEQAPVEDPNAGMPVQSEQDMLEQQVVDLTARIENSQKQKTNLEVQLQQKDQDILTLQGDLAKLQDQVNLQKDAQKQAVAKIYERMNADDAVKILEGMEADRAAIIIGGMKQETAAEILAGFDPARARLISDILAGFSPALPSAAVRTPVTPGQDPATAGQPGGTQEGVAQPLQPAAAGTPEDTEAGDQTEDAAANGN